jgi:hypothetical protein
LKGKASIRNRIGRLEGWNISSEMEVKQREREINTSKMKGKINPNAIFVRTKSDMMRCMNAR